MTDMAPRENSMSPPASIGDVKKLIQSLRVLIVEDNQYVRNTIRMLLTNIGVKKLYEAPDGMMALDTIRTVSPDLIILDAEMPFMSGAELARIVRSPNGCPTPDVPIIMLTGHGERWRVVEAARLGINEFLVKPVSSKQLLERMIAIFGKPRAAVEREGYRGPEPRKELPAPMPKPTALPRPVPRDKGEDLVG
jgi:two-component system, chemotaxis family, chemotaxis protein CheY